MKKDARKACFFFKTLLRQSVGSSIIGTGIQGEDCAFPSIHQYSCNKRSKVNKIQDQYLFIVRKFTFSFSRFEVLLLFCDSFLRTLGISPHEFLNRKTHSTPNANCFIFHFFYRNNKLKNKELVVWVSSFRCKSYESSQ